MPWSAWAFPVLSLAFYGLTSVTGFGGFAPSPTGFTFAVILMPILFGAVFASVYHAEIIAHRTGEPYGTLVLTSAVTVIEVALITSVMLSPPAEGTGPVNTIARDTVYAVVMVVCAGMVGLCIFVGGLRHHEQSFRVTGASAYLAVLLCQVVLTLILPNYTRTTAGPIYSTSQLVFISVVTIALYGVFLYIQTVRHRDYFIMRGGQKKNMRMEEIVRSSGGEGLDSIDASGRDHDHADRPSNREVAISGVLLLLSLTGVILLAKKFAAVAQAATSSIGAPDAAVGVIVAILILLPEGVAAVNAARRDEFQKSINLALGSSLATIGLTIPAVSVVSVILGQDLVLGLDTKDTILVVLTLATSILTFGTGRTNMLFGAVHLVVFATFLFLTFVP
jgi:Ca2+:H+ antiporter